MEQQVKIKSEAVETANQKFNRKFEADKVYTARCSDNKVTADRVGYFIQEQTGSGAFRFKKDELEFIAVPEKEVQESLPDNQVSKVAEPDEVDAAPENVPVTPYWSSPKKPGRKTSKKKPGRK